jgi:hypothetical protein
VDALQEGRVGEAAVGPGHDVLRPDDVGLRFDASSAAWKFAMSRSIAVRSYSMGPVQVLMDGGGRTNSASAKSRMSSASCWP